MRLITLSKYCEPIFEKVKKGELSKEGAFDSIEKYQLFLSQKVTLDMFVGENAKAKHIFSREINMLRLLNSWSIVAD